MNYRFGGEDIVRTINVRWRNIIRNLNPIITPRQRIGGGGLHRGSSTGPWPCLSSTGPCSGSLSIQVFNCTPGHVRTCSNLTSQYIPQTCSSGMFNLDLTDHTQDMFKIVHHVFHTIGKRVVGIGLKCLLRSMLI